MGPIKVAIADDHKIFRKGVILSLRPFTNIKFVQEAENGDDLLGGLAASEPDVVLMDLRMPGKDGIEATSGSEAGNPFNRSSPFSASCTNLILVKGRRERITPLRNIL